jgi:hypothetical protein
LRITDIDLLKPNGLLCEVTSNSKRCNKKAKYRIYLSNVNLPLLSEEDVPQVTYCCFDCLDPLAKIVKKTQLKESPK